MPTRDEVLARRALWPLGTIVYSQSAIDPATGYRQDCSGGVSMCWATPKPGQSTVTLLPDVMAEITPDELLPGDALGHCGPGTGGNAGHIMLFLGWTQTGMMIWEQAGGPPGPAERHIKAIPAGYKPYRLKGITDMAGDYGELGPPPNEAPYAYDHPDVMLADIHAALVSRKTGWGGVDSAEPWALFTDLAAINAKLDQALMLLANLPDAPAGPVADHQHTPGGVARPPQP